MLKSSQIIETNSFDDLLYEAICRLLRQIRLSQGGTALDSTLRRHTKIRNYLLSKQVARLRDFEETYFNDDGTLNETALQTYKNGLQCNCGEILITRKGN